MAHVYTNDLPVVVDIIDHVSPPPRYEEGDIEELRESIQLIIVDFIGNNIRECMHEDIEQRIFDYVRGILLVLHNNVFEIFKDINIDDYVNEGIFVYLNLIGVPRSCPTDTVVDTQPTESIEEQIETLRNMEQPEQRTSEWFAFRRNRLTASTAWKALDSSSNVNQLIYSKCAPLDTCKYSRVNVESATHHGNKYETLSKLLYEAKYDTTVEEFGCIADAHHSFLGASPDGINVKKGNMRYGRLLEIKNPVSREITGIPKKEYWVQMQVQMHVLGLHLCDFLETSFKEYNDETAFKNDGTFSSSECGNRKGIIACFHDGSSPVYKEAPTNCTSFEGPEGFDAWLSSTIEANGNLTWIRNSYWKLGKMSCVLVRYNPEWMCYALKEFENVWNAVLYDREHGYEHRKPKKREKRKKCTPSQPMSIQQLGMAQESFKNAVIKIRTESFDESSI